MIGKYGLHHDRIWQKTGLVKNTLFIGAILMLALFLGACSEAVDGEGSDPARDSGDELRGEDNTDNLAKYQPCANKTCGDSCTICDPNDRGCNETAVLKYCDADGSCKPTAPRCVEPEPPGDYEPCEGKTCGERCTVCDPNDPDCRETDVLKYCDAAGSCKPTTPRCVEPEPPGHYEPCEGKTCGDTCTICDPNDRDCHETAVVKYCGADGSCGALEPRCDEPQPPEDYEPCEGKSCGDSCTICDPNDPECVETAVVKYCNQQGSCTPTEPVCFGTSPIPYEPCAGKTCGDYCSVCDPNDRDCHETAVVKYCGSDGSCSPHAQCVD